MVQLGQSRLVAVNTKYSVKYEAKWIQVFLIKGTEKILYYRYGRRPVDSLVYAIKQKRSFLLRAPVVQSALIRLTGLVQLQDGVLIMTRHYPSEVVGSVLRVLYV